MNNKIEITTKNASETKKLGSLLAKTIIDGSPTSINSTIISLEGDLGTGKTTFTQGFAEGLGIREKIQSPTYVILKIYNLTASASRKRANDIFTSDKKNKILLKRAKASGNKKFIHIDAYRVGPKDFVILGWKNFIKNPNNIIMVEWGDRIKKILPKNTTHILFSHQKCDERKIKFFNETK